jgi:similar to stage IV sporulation protein
VGEGDKVKKGQVLIAGYVYPQIIVSEEGQISPGGEPQEVRAKGVVRARVVRSCIEQCPMREEIKKDTGVEEKVVLLKLLGKEVYLRGTGESPFAHFRSIRQVKPLLDIRGRNLQGTVELITIIYKEQTCEVLEWGVEGAYQEAGRRAHALLERDLPQDCKIVERKIEPLPAQKTGMVAIRYILETLENIGVYPPRTVKAPKP